jgi:hypothetical protein
MHRKWAAHATSKSNDEEELDGALVEMIQEEGCRYRKGPEL